MNRDIMLKRIKKYLLTVKLNIQYDNEAGLFDINKHCENFYCGLLNLVYGYQLKNANIEEKNFDSVDLIDDISGVYFQITSNKRSEKIKDTIDKFIKKEFYKKNKLKVLIIGNNKANYRAKFNTHDKFEFNKSKDIIDDTNLYYEISNKPIDLINNIMLYLSKELDEKHNFVNLDIEKKYEETNIEFFSKRFLYNADEYKKDGYFSEYKVSRIEDILIENNKIVIIGDAGTGKSEICKNLNNIINKDINKISFYYKLLNYTGENIDELKPLSYLSIPNELVTFILDGFDEIKNDFKDIFIKKIQSFSNQYRNIKIIITTRSNFYESINDFRAYYLVDFNEKNIKEICKYYCANYDNFQLNIRRNELNYIISNPFYADYLIRYYSIHKELPNREEIIPKIIDEIFYADVSKYKTTKDLISVKNKIFNMLKMIAFSMAMLGKNNLDINELNSMIPNTEDRNLLNYLSIWKNENDKFRFIHNNYYEYLAAEKLLELDTEKIKEIITYDCVTFNPNWMNIVVLMISKKFDIDFINWLLYIYPNFIFYLEKDKIDKEKRIDLFKKTFAIYENKRIWLPNNIYYNDRFANFIYCNEIIEFLITKLNYNNHYTIIFNALNLIEQFNIIENVNVVKEPLVEILYCNKYNTSQKRIALNILSKNHMINDDEFINIIKYNSDIEDSYLRASYYYYLNKNEVNMNNISVLLNRIENSKIKYSSSWDNDDEVDLMDEHLEFNRVFLHINKKELLNILLSKVDEIKDVHNSSILSEEIIKNICESIESLLIEKTEKLELFYKFYKIIDKKFLHRELKIIIGYLDKNDIRLDFFKQFLEDTNQDYYSINFLTDDECLDYFYKKYNAKYFTDEIAYKMLASYSDSNDINYIKLNDLYYERTGLNFIEKRKNSGNLKSIKGKSIQDYFNSIFNKEKFIDNLYEYLSQFNLKDKSRIEKSDLKTIREEYYENNDKYNYIADFLGRFGKKSDYILIEDIKNIDWDYFILIESYNVLIYENEINVSKEQREIIQNICLNYLPKISYRNAIKYSRNGQYTTSYLSIYLWFMRYKLNLKYPESVLLDMLSFDWGNIDHQALGIQYIIDSVPEYKVKKRIIENIKTKNMHGDVLKNHITYCIKNDISDLFPFLKKYLINKKNKYYEKQEIIEYVLKYCSISFIKDNILDIVDFDTRNCFISGIYKIDKNFLIEYIIQKCKYSKIEYQRNIYLKYLIKSNNIWGLMKYYELLKQKMQTLDGKNDFQNTFKNALCEVDNINCLDIISNIFMLSFDPSFKDNKFESIYSGCKEAFIKIAFSDLKNNSYLEVINKLQYIIDNNSEINNIGFTYYIIDEIKNRYYLLTKNQYSINQIITKTNDLFRKKAVTGLIY